MLKIFVKATLLSFLAMPLMTSNLTAREVSQAPQSKEMQHIYEKPTFKKLSQLYWALSKFDLSSNWAIDNFMIINECEIYRKYSNNEFEWKDVREAGRQYIKSNVDDFPVRFEIVQPLRLSEYDFERQVFNIWKPFKIEGARLFEVLSPEYRNKICGETSEIKGYPKGLILEFTRPVTIEHIKMSPEVAKAYVALKQKYAPKAEQIKRNKSELYKTRDAYLIMKTKIFSFKENDRSYDGDLRAKVLAALEGYEIYADRNRQNLLYSEVFRQREASRGTAEVELKKRFEARKKKREEAAAAKSKQ